MRGAPGPALQHEIERRLSSLLAVPAAGRDSEPATTLAMLHAAGRLTAADKQRISTAGLREVIAPCVAALVTTNPPRSSETPAARGRVDTLRP